MFKKFFLKDESGAKDTGNIQKGHKNRESKKTKNKKKNTHKDPTATENPKHPNKNQQPSKTLHHSNPLAFALSRTKTPSIVIDIALKVMKFNLSSSFGIGSLCSSKF
jgi:hypothetical protein